MTCRIVAALLSCFVLVVIGCDREPPGDPPAETSEREAPPSSESEQRPERSKAVEPPAVKEESTENGAGESSGVGHERLLEPYLRAEREGGAMTCGERERQVKASIAGLPKECRTTADCTRVSFNCPFGCWHFVANSQRLDDARAEAAIYRRNCGPRCSDRCGGPAPAVCDDGVCVAGKLEKPVKPEKDGIIDLF